MDKYSIIKLKGQGKSNRAVADLLGINRKTVARYWNSYLKETEKLQIADADVKQIQEVIVSNPKYDSKNRSKRKYTVLIDEALELILDGEAVKAKLLGTNKQQLSVVQIHQELVNQGFDIGKTTISEKIREKRQRFKECFIKQDYDYGDRLEYDFGEVKLIINNVAIKYHIAVLSSPASNFRWAYLYKNQKKEVFFDSHVRFFEMMKGSYKEVVYDNMRNVVTRFIGKHEKQLNEELIKLSIYYGFDINVTNCYKGNEKGHVEGSVKVIRNRIFGPRYKFTSYEEAESYLQRMLITLNDTSLIEEEKQHLLDYRPKLELAEIRCLKVNSYSFARAENNFYSVPDYLVGKEITAKVYFDRIHFYASNHFVCEHKKIDGSNETSIDIRHYIKSFEKKPGALNNSFALKNIPRLKSIYDIYFKRNPKKFIALLNKYKENEINEIVRLIKNEINSEFNSINYSVQSEVTSLTENQLKLYNNLSIKEVQTNDHTRISGSSKTPLH